MERLAPLTSSLPQLTSISELALIIICLQMMDTAWGIRLQSVDVPSPSFIGESVELSCLYDLQDEKLYSVKWYKDNVEFYRYVPNDKPPAQYLPVPGIHIDLSKSSQFTVFLTNLDLHSSGTYRCEVSGEAPLFDTQEAEKELQVFVLPSHGPTISGSQPHYKLGDSVHLNCTSARSKPSAVLKWFINDEPVRSDYEIEYPPVTTPDGLESTTLGLRFLVSQDNFEQGNVRFRCVATISRVYTMTNEELALGGLRAQTSGATSLLTYPTPTPTTNPAFQLHHKGDDDEVNVRGTSWTRSRTKNDRWKSNQKGVESWWSSSSWRDSLNRKRPSLKTAFFLTVAFFQGSTGYLRFWL